MVFVGSTSSRQHFKLVLYINPSQYHGWLFLEGAIGLCNLGLFLVDSWTTDDYGAGNDKEKFWTLSSNVTQKFLVFQECIRETETWMKVLQTQTYWSKISFQTSVPTFQWCFKRKHFHSSSFSENYFVQMFNTIACKKASCERWI